MFEALEHYLTKLEIFKRVEKISKLDSELQHSIHVILVSFVDVCGLAHKLAFGSKTSKFKAGTLAVLCHDDSGLSGALKQFNDLIERQNGVVMALNLEHTLKIKEQTQQIPGIAAEVTAIRTVYSKNMEVLVSDVENRSSEKSAEEQRAALIKILEIPKDVMEEQERLVETIKYDCLPDSGLELQANPDYLKWVDFNSDAKPTLFLSGDPRSGKSYFIHAIIDAVNVGPSQSTDNEKSIPKSRVVVARYHFEKLDDRSATGSTKARTRHERPLELALKYMCFQVAQQHKGYAKELTGLLREFKPRGKTSEELWSNLMLGRPRGDVTHVIVFDGVDQIPGEDSAALFQLVAMQQNSNDGTMSASPNRSSVRILVSSTPQSFDSFPAAKLIGIPILDAATMNKSNIRSLIEQELKSNKTWQEDGENMKALMAYIREELPDRSNGDFGIAMQALHSVRKAVEDGGGINSMKMILRNACERDPITMAAEAIDGLSKSLSIPDIQRLNNLLIWVIWARLRFNLEELRAICYMESRDDPCQFESLIKSKYSRVFSMHADGTVTVREEIGDYFRNKSDERSKASQGGVATGPKISMEIKINNASVTEVKRFLWNLNERANLDGFFSVGTDAQVQDKTIDVYPLDSYLHISEKLLELLNDEFEEITEPIFQYAILSLHDHLRILYARKALLEPKEIKVILSGVIAFLTDIDMFDQHSFPASLVWQTWLVDEESQPEHIIREWLTFGDGIKVLDRKDQRRLRKLMTPEHGYLGFYRPLALLMAKRWLQGPLDLSFEAFHFVLRYIESVSFASDSWKAILILKQEKFWGASQLTQAGSVRSTTSSVPEASAIESLHSIEQDPAQQPRVTEKARADLVVGWMKRNLEHWEENGTWFERVGYVYLRIDLPYFALKAFDAGKLMSHDNPQIYWGCARACAQQGDMEGAIEEQLTGLRLVEPVSGTRPAGPDYAINVRQLVIWYISCRQFEKAIEEACVALHTIPFEYELHFLVLEAARQSGNQVYIRDYFTTTLKEPDEGGHSDKLTGVVKFAVNRFEEDDEDGTVWSIEKVVVSARNAETLPLVLESLRYLISSEQQHSFLTTCRLFESFILASISTVMEPDSLHRSIEIAERIVKDEQSLAEFKRSDPSDIGLILRETFQHLADIYFAQLVVLKVDDNGKEQILTRMEDLISLSKSKMVTSNLPYGHSHLAAYYAISGKEEKAKVLLRPLLEDALDLLVDDTPENDPDAFFGLALALGYLQDEYNSLTAWSLLAPYNGEGDDDRNGARATAQLGSNKNEFELSERQGDEVDMLMEPAENGPATTHAAGKSETEATMMAGPVTQRQNSNNGVVASLTGRSDEGSDPKESQPSVAIGDFIKPGDERRKHSSPDLEGPFPKRGGINKEGAEMLEKRMLLEDKLRKENKPEDTEAQAAQARAVLRKESHSPRDGLKRHESQSTLQAQEKEREREEDVKRKKYRSMLLLKEKEMEASKEADFEKQIRKRALENGGPLSVTVRIW